MSDPEQVARAVLHAYFDGAEFRRVPLRCVKAVEDVAPPVTAAELRARLERVTGGPLPDDIEAAQIAQEAPLTSPVTCAACGQPLTMNALGKIDHHCPPKGSSTLVESTQAEVLCDGCKDEADSKLYAGPQGMRLCEACLLDCGGKPECCPVVYTAPTEGKQR